MNAVASTDFKFDQLENVYRGKVRDVYTVAGKFIAVATDRISAFDHILPRPIPYKGQVLNQIAARNLEASRHIVPNWLEAVPDPQVSVGKICEPLKIEMVIRGYLAGHSWRLYRDGLRLICGESMPSGMRESDPFATPLITPATKADAGHDEDISREEIIKKGIVTEEVYDELAYYTRNLFAFGSQQAKRQGLILVDTKYEFGLYEGDIYLIDEVHTPDSSRYFYQDGYEEKQAKGLRQKQLSKEFVREWLIANGFQGLEGQQMPEMPDEFVELVSARYIELYEQLTGEQFVRAGTDHPSDRIEQNILDYLSAG